jgi:hypothetical protein
VAKLRSTKTDNNLLLLKTELGAGHFSVTGRWGRRGLLLATLLGGFGGGTVETSLRVGRGKSLRWADAGRFAGLVEVAGSLAAPSRQGRL